MRDVVINSPWVADLSGREGAAYMSPSRPQRARGQSAHINIVSTVPDWSVLTVVKGRLGHLCDWKPQTAENRFSRPMNSGRPYGAGNLSRPLVKPAKQPSGCLFECLRISVAPEFHKQELTTGVFRSVGKAFGVLRNE